MIVSRRGLFGGVAALLAAPAIVRASSLMKVVAWQEPLLVVPRFTGYSSFRLIGLDEYGYPKITNFDQVTVDTMKNNALLGGLIASGDVMIRG